MNIRDCEQHDGADLKDDRPSLVSLGRLARSARNLSSHSLDGRSIDTMLEEEADGADETCRRIPVRSKLAVRRLPPRSFSCKNLSMGRGMSAVEDDVAEANSPNPEISVRAAPKRRMLPRRSLSQRFDRQALLKEDEDDDDSNSSSQQAVEE